MIAETEIINTLKATLSHERFIHSISTSKTAASYAKMLKADEEKAYIAGLVHDCAKYLPSSELLRQSELAGIAIDSIQRIAPSLLHGSLGAVYAKERFQIDDEEVLSAISWHTTGKAAMTDLEKIIFLADLTEEGRDAEFDDSALIRQTAAHDFDKAMLMAFDGVIRAVLDKGGLLHFSTVEARNGMLLA